MDGFRTLETETLLLRGDRSRAFFRPIIDTLGTTLPRSSRVVIEGTGHLGPSDEGLPEAAASALGKFFITSEPSAAPTG